MDIPLTQKLKDKFEELKRSKNYTKFRFDKNELDFVKMDITFYEQSKKVNPCFLAVEWTKQVLSQHPEIKPIMQVMKRYLQINRLNSPFNGLFLC